MNRAAVFTAFSTLLLAACTDGPTTAPLSAPPLASISDATSDGNDRFFWLPPMVDQPTTSGVANPGLSPELEICDEQGVDLSGQCIATKALYTTTSGPLGSETEVVRVDAQMHYQVNVHTDDIGLEAGKTYRWRVLLHGFELGHADIVMAANGNEAKKVDEEKFVGLVDGRTFPTRFRVEEGVGGGTFTPDGGLATLTENGFVVAGLEAPPGAVDEETNILIEGVACSELATGRTTAPPCYEFTADREVTFLEPVAAGMCVDVSGLTPVQIERIALYKDDGGPNVRELAHITEPVFLQCEEAEGIAAADGNPLLHFARAGWRAVQRHLNPWFSPAPAFAIDLGRGGEVPKDDGLSIIGWAVERVLIYGPSLVPSTAFRPLNEQTGAEEFGYTVDVVDGETWSAKPATGMNGFGDYDAIVFGEAGSATDLEAAGTGWSASVTGPALISALHAQEHQCEVGQESFPGSGFFCLESDPQSGGIVHRPEAQTFLRNAIRWATSGTRTGLYVGLGGRFEAEATPKTLSFLGGIGDADFSVIGVGVVQTPQQDTVSITDGDHPVVFGLSNAGLSGWFASVHELMASFEAFPSDFFTLATGVRRTQVCDPETETCEFQEESLPAIIARPQPAPTPPPPPIE